MTTPTTGRTPLRLLIIEDDENDAELAALSFRHSDYDVIRWLQVHSIDEMRDAMLRSPFDVVISDCSIPGFSVSEALKDAIRIRPDIPFILMSGAIGEATAVALMSEGAADFVPKSSLARLPESVRRARATRPAVAPVAPTEPDLSSAFEPPLATDAPSAPEAAPRRPLRHVLARAACLGLAYMGLAWLINGLTAFGGDNGGVASFWPAAGITVAVLIRSPQREWPWLVAAIFAGESTIDLLASTPVWQAIGWGVADAVGPLASVLFLRWMGRRTVDLRITADLVRFVGAAVVAGPGVGALIGATTTRLVNAEPFLSALDRWWFSDAIGVVILAPLALLPFRELRPSTWWRPKPLQLVFLAPLAFAFNPWAETKDINSAYVLLPALVFVALRGTPAQTAVTMAAVGMGVNLLTAMGYGPLAPGETETVFLSGQAFLGICAFTTLTVSALSSELVARQKLQEVLEAQSLHDSLTGLANRRLINLRMQALSRQPDTMIGMLFIDINEFRAINDLFGHAAGDALLVETGRRIKSVILAEDSVARLGGDEFLVLLDNVVSTQAIGQIADRLTAELARPFPWGQTQIETSATVGVAVSNDEAHDIEALLVDADRDMYRVRASRARGTHNHGAPTSSSRTRILREDVPGALYRGEFHVVYQPIVDLRSGELSGAEALLRWTHPVLGAVGPDEFIPIAEETGAIIDLGRFVLFDACRHAQQWNQGAHRPIAVDVNVSGRQLEHPSLEKDIANALRSAQLDPALLVIEITESVLATDVTETGRLLDQLRTHGVRIAMDDFGTGYSSLAALSAYQLDIIKIDKAFVADAAKSDAVGLLRWIVALGVELDIQMIAEGVETEEQVADLAEAGCRYGQGYLFAKPESAGDFAKRVAAGRGNPRPRRLGLV